jgi:hypothetical protein
MMIIIKQKYKKYPNMSNEITPIIIAHGKMVIFLVRRIYL